MLTRTTCPASCHAAQSSVPSWARLGRRVAIVDGLPALGGQAVNSIIGTFCGLFSNGPNRFQLTHGIADGILKDLGAKGALHHNVGPMTTVVYYEEVALARWIEQKVRAAGITVVLGAVLRDCSLENRRITALELATRYGDVRIKAQGFGGYFKSMLFPPGVPPALYVLVTGDEKPGWDLIPPLLALQNDPAIETIIGDSVYVMNLQLDQREETPGVRAKDGSKLPENPLRDIRVREAIDLAIDRRITVGETPETVRAEVEAAFTTVPGHEEKAGRGAVRKGRLARRKSAGDGRRKRRLRFRRSRRPDDLPRR